VFLALDGCVRDGGVLLVGDARVQRNEIPRVVAFLTEAEFRGEVGLNVHRGRDARDGEQAGRLAVSHANDRGEQLLAVGRGGRVVVRRAAAPKRRGTEQCAAGRREDGNRQRHSPESPPHAGAQSSSLLKNAREELLAGDPGRSSWEGRSSVTEGRSGLLTGV